MYVCSEWQSSKIFGSPQAAKLLFRAEKLREGIKNYMNILSVYQLVRIKRCMVALSRKSSAFINLLFVFAMLSLAELKSTGGVMIDLTTNSVSI